MVPFMISVAPNGARRTHSDHPALPVTPSELAATAAECLDAGASLLHMHVRDRDGHHSLDADHYREATQAVKAAVGDRLIIQVSTEAAGIYGRDEQMALLRALRPEAASLAIAELVPDAACEQEAAALFTWLRREHVLVQWILYSQADVLRFRDLLQRGVVPNPEPYVLFVIGRKPANGSEIRAGAKQLVPFLSAWQELDSPWAVCAFNEAEHPCVVAAVAMDGHARVGFENNLRLADGTMAPNNASLVRQAVRTAALAGRPVADVGWAREMLTAR